MPKVAKIYLQEEWPKVIVQTREEFYKVVPSIEVVTIPEPATQLLITSEMSAKSYFSNFCENEFPNEMRNTPPLMMLPPNATTNSDILVAKPKQNRVVPKKVPKKENRPKEIRPKDNGKQKSNIRKIAQRKQFSLSGNFSLDKKLPVERRSDSWEAMKDFKPINLAVASSSGNEDLTNYGFSFEEKPSWEEPNASITTQSNDCLDDFQHNKPPNKCYLTDSNVQYTIGNATKLIDGMNTIIIGDSSCGNLELFTRRELEKVPDEIFEYPDRSGESQERDEDEPKSMVKDEIINQVKLLNPATGQLEIEDWDINNFVIKKLPSIVSLSGQPTTSVEDIKTTDAVSVPSETSFAIDNLEAEGAKFNNADEFSTSDATVDEKRETTISDLPITSDQIKQEHLLKNYSPMDSGVSTDSVLSDLDVGSRESAYNDYTYIEKVASEDLDRTNSLASSKMKPIIISNISVVPPKTTINNSYNLVKVVDTQITDNKIENVETDISPNDKPVCFDKEVDSDMFTDNIDPIKIEVADLIAEIESRNAAAASEEVKDKVRDVGRTLQTKINSIKKSFEFFADRINLTFDKLNSISTDFDIWNEIKYLKFLEKITKDTVEYFEMNENKQFIPNFLDTMDKNDSKSKVETAIENRSDCKHFRPACTMCDVDLQQNSARSDFDEFSMGRFSGAVNNLIRVDSEYKRNIPALEIRLKKLNEISLYKTKRNKDKARGKSKNAKGNETRKGPLLVPLRRSQRIRKRPDFYSDEKFAIPKPHSTHGSLKCQKNSHFKSTVNKRADNSPCVVFYKKSRRM